MSSSGTVTKIQFNLLIVKVGKHCTCKFNFSVKTRGKNLVICDRTLKLFFQLKPKTTKLQRRQLYRKDSQYCAFCLATNLKDNLEAFEFGLLDDNLAPIYTLSSD